MSKIRVLIVDDSVVIRRLLTEDLSSDPTIEVVGTAPDGQIGLAKIAQVNPDIVILDVEMPVMDGLQTLTEIRKIYALLPVIMFSTLTSSGTSATIEALVLGASDYATKPSTTENTRQSARTELIPKIKHLCQRELSTNDIDEAPTRRPQELISKATSATASPVQIVAIGVSTGGPNALAALLPCLDKAFPVPVVIVQHMPKVFTGLLAARLTAVSGFSVNEGKAGELLRSGEMWIAPGGYHMEVQKNFDGIRLRTHEGPLENSCRPAVDVLFRSVAEVYGSGVLAVVLTGMGYDGLRGSENIREAGGSVIAQDEASSVVWGMPGAVTRAGLADKVLPLNQIALEINRRVLPRSTQNLKRRDTNLFHHHSFAKSL
jgi:two-component system chemotaxis response regulator CheB